MKSTPISNTITYIEATDVHPSLSCAALVISSAPRIVIDLNLSDRDTEAVLTELQPEQAYTTHFHLDHSRFWVLVEKHSTADFFIPSGEEQILARREEYLKQTPGPKSMAQVWESFLEIIRYREIKHYRTFDETHHIRSGSNIIECIRTPGHSPSHTSFYLPSERILFTGDLGLGKFGPWYGWANCSIPDYIESLLKLKGMKTNILLTSHEGIFRTGIDAVWDNCLFQFFRRERDIRHQLDQGKTVAEMVAKGIYFTNKESVSEPMKTLITIWDEAMLMYHLELLENQPLELLYPGLSSRLWAREN